nr:type 2 phosphatidylinositol 4,5-bisphosphate 4-phosphatase isoform X4 [Anser cygnoides]
MEFFIFLKIVTLLLATPSCSALPRLPSRGYRAGGSPQPPGDSRGRSGGPRGPSWAPAGADRSGAAQPCGRRGGRAEAGPAAPAPASLLPAARSSQPLPLRCFSSSSSSSFSSFSFFPGPAAHPPARRQRGGPCPPQPWLPRGWTSAPRCSRRPAPAMSPPPRRPTCRTPALEDVGFCNHDVKAEGVKFPISSRGASVCAITSELHCCI